MTKTPPGTKLGRLLRDGREHQRPLMTQVAAAKIAGVHRNTIGTWEHQSLDESVKLPDWTSLMRLTKALGLDSGRAARQVRDAWTEIATFVPATTEALTQLEGAGSPD